MADTGSGTNVLKVVGGLFGLLAWVVFLGMQRIWRATFGWLFNTLAGLLDRAVIPVPHFHDIHIFGPVSAWLRSLDRNVFTLLGTLALQSEHLAVWLLSRFHLLWSWIGREIEGLSADVLAWGSRLVHVYLPRWLRTLWHQFARGWARIWKYVRSQLPGIWRLLKRYGRSIAHQAGITARNWLHNLKLFAWLERKVFGFIRAAAKRLLALERHFVPKGLRKWFAALFPIFGISWLLGSSWKRLGSGLLKWTYHQVTAFLAWFGHLDDDISIKEVTHEAQKLVPVALEAMDFWISEFKAQRVAPGPVNPPPEA